MTPIAAAVSMHFHAIIPFQADVTFMYVLSSKKQTVHKSVQRFVLTLWQKRTRRSETTGRSSFDGQAIATNTLSFGILFSDEPPPFGGIWASRSGNDTTSETFSFHVSSNLFMRMATAFFDHRTLCEEFTQKHTVIGIVGKAEGVRGSHKLFIASE
jgi:hypothetical protein